MFDIDVNQFVKLCFKNFETDEIICFPSLQVEFTLKIKKYLFVSFLNFAVDRFLSTYVSAK